MMQMAALSVAFSNLCIYGCMHKNGNCVYCKLDGSTLPFKNVCFNYIDEVNSPISLIEIIAYIHYSSRIAIRLASFSKF